MTKPANLRLANQEAPSQRSPERARLADAIGARTAAEQALEAHKRAIARAGDAVEKAEASLEAARGAAAEARGQRAHELAEAATTGVPPAANPRRGARAPEIDAEEEYLAACTALEQLREHLPRLEADVRRAGGPVVAAVDRIILPVAQHVLDEAQKALAELVDKRRLLCFMQNIGEPRRPGPRVLSELDRAISDFLDRKLLHDGWEFEKYPSTAPWHAARAALMDNPDAPLPPLG